MPLLKHEVDIFPHDFFDLPAKDLPWRILHVRGRHEKLVTRACVEAGVAVYLPQAEKRVRKDNRTFVSHLPLFPGYVFSRGDRRSDAALWRSGGVVRILPVGDQEQLRAELLQLYELQRAGLSLVPHPYVAVGDEVRITDGVFAGYRGVVTREKGRDVLVVSVSMIQHSVSVELGRGNVAPRTSMSRAG